MNIDPVRARFKISIDVDTEKARLEIFEGEKDKPGYKHMGIPISLTTRLEYIKHPDYVAIKRVYEFETSAAIKAHLLYREGFDAEARMERDLEERTL